MAAPITFTRQFYHRKTNASVYKHLKQLIYGQNPELFIFFLLLLLSSPTTSSLAPTELTREVTQLKRPSIVRKFLKKGSFVLSLKRIYSLCWASTVYMITKPCYTRHFDRACLRPRNNEIISYGAWVGLIMYYNFYTYQKRTETSSRKQVSIKIFLKRNLADVGMNQWMLWLTKYTNKECHTVMCTP